VTRLRLVASTSASLNVNGVMAARRMASEASIARAADAVADVEKAGRVRVVATTARAPGRPAENGVIVKTGASDAGTMSLVIASPPWAAFANRSGTNAYRGNRTSVRYLRLDSRENPKRTSKRAG
jgi:hypothetical protein